MSAICRGGMLLHRHQRLLSGSQSVCIQELLRGAAGAKGTRAERNRRRNFAAEAGETGSMFGDDLDSDEDGAAKGGSTPPPRSLEVLCFVALGKRPCLPAVSPLPTNLASCTPRSL